MKYSIITEGMGCPHCIKRVTKAMEGVGAEIHRVELNDISVSTDKAPEALRAAIEALGFKVKSVTAEPAGRA